MQNNIVAYLTYLSLIFVTAKLWGVLEWDWLAVTAPVWGLFMVSVIWVAVQRSFQKKNAQADIVGVLNNLRNVIEMAKKKESEQNERTIN